MAGSLPSLEFAEDLQGESPLEAPELERNDSRTSHGAASQGAASRYLSPTPFSGTTDVGELEDDICEAPCRHHPPSLKYPSLDLPHANNLHKFIRDVSCALKSTYPRNRYVSANYDTAHMLFLRWEADDLDTQYEIDELRPLLQSLKFTAQNDSLTSEQYNIPSEDPQDSLEEILVLRRNKFAKKPRQLLLIYYGGHGRMNQLRQCIWYPWLNPPTGSYGRPEIDWTSLQARLHKCEGDVVFILDCCHASSMVRASHSAWSGLKELLVASGKNEKTEGVSDNSFTRAIIRELKNLKGKATSISGLQAAMVEHQDIHGLRNTPIRIGLSERANRFESLQLVYPFTTTDDSSVENIDSAAMDYGSRVLVSIRLRHPANPPVMSDWLPWLQKQAPQDVLDLKVSWTNYVRPEAVFKHGSTLMLFSMPLTIWNALPHDNAYSFIDVIKSGNLLSQSIGKGKEPHGVFTPTPRSSQRSPGKRPASEEVPSSRLSTSPSPLVNQLISKVPVLNSGEPPHPQDFRMSFLTWEERQGLMHRRLESYQIEPPAVFYFWDPNDSVGYFVVQPRQTPGKIVARREDNDMVNATQLLNVAGAPAVRQEDFLLFERVQGVVRDEPMKPMLGAWIPLSSAKSLAHRLKVKDLLYPLFTKNLGRYIHRLQKAAGKQMPLHARQVHTLKRKLSSGEFPSLNSLTTLNVPPEATRGPVEPWNHLSLYTTYHPNANLDIPWSATNTTESVENTTIATRSVEGVTNRTNTTPSVESDDSMSDCTG